MKGILLAGGAGTRLSPLTTGVTKQLLPIYDKPMVYYPLCILMEAFITEILVISTSRDQPNLQRLLKNGSQWGLNICYETQDSPNGIAEAFLIGEKFLDGSDVMLALGDNVLWSPNLKKILVTAKANLLTKGGGVNFTFPVSDPENFGVVNRRAFGEVVAIEEKPQFPKSNEVSIGFYMYDGSVCERTKKIKPSRRKEYEITDVSNSYIKDGTLEAYQVEENGIWLDTGTITSLFKSSTFIQIAQERFNTLIGSPEWTALNLGLVEPTKYKNIETNSEYYKTLSSLVRTRFF